MINLQCDGIELKLQDFSFSNLSIFSRKSRIFLNDLVMEKE